MKYGFIGCGNMGGAVAKALSKATREILVSDRSGKARALAVTTGIEESGWVEVDGEQLAEDMQYVVDGQFQIDDGTPLRIAEPGK